MTESSPDRPCPYCHRSPARCYLLEEMQNQSQSGGFAPTPDSAVFNGPIWPRKRWTSYTDRVVQAAAEYGCLVPQSEVKKRAQEITHQKEDRFELTD